MITVPRLKKGQGLKGPEYFGCFNTGVAPTIIRSLTGKYGVGPELACHDAIHRYVSFTDKRSTGEGRQKVCIYKHRGPAVKKFLALCGQQITDNHAMREEYIATRRKADAGDIAAALHLGDF